MSSQQQGHSLQLTIRFRENSRDDVVQRYCSDVMKGGMLIRTVRDPLLQLGVQVRLRFVLSNGQEIFRGTGIVAWLQQRDAVVGVGVQFEGLSDEADALYHDMLARREALQSKTVRDPMEEFYDGPTTRVESPDRCLV